MNVRFLGVGGSLSKQQICDRAEISAQHVCDQQICDMLIFQHISFVMSKAYEIVGDM